MLVDVEPSRAVASADMLPAKVCLHANARGKEACVVGIATRVEDEAEVEEARKLMKKRRVDKANGTMLRIVVDRVTVSAAGSPQEEVDAAAFAEAERDHGIGEAHPSPLSIDALGRGVRGEEPSFRQSMEE